jgi:hypothetical protein
LLIRNNPFATQYARHEATIFRRLRNLNYNEKQRTQANIQEVNNGNTCKQKATTCISITLNLRE